MEHLKTFLTVLVFTWLTFWQITYADEYLYCPRLDQLSYDASNNTWSSTAPLGKYSKFTQFGDGKLVSFNDALASPRESKFVNEIICRYKLTNGTLLVSAVAPPPSPSMFILYDLHWYLNVGECRAKNPETCDFSLQNSAGEEISASIKK